MQSLISMVVQIQNDRHMWVAANMGYYVKTRFTPREIARLKRELESGLYELELRNDLGIVETIKVDVPTTLVQAIRDV